MRENKPLDLKSVYLFDEFSNNQNINAAKELMNRLRAMTFLVVGITPEGEMSIHSAINPTDLKYLLEKLIRSLPDGKAVISI